MIKSLAFIVGISVSAVSCISSDLNAAHDDLISQIEKSGWATSSVSETTKLLLEPGIHKAATINTHPWDEGKKALLLKALKPNPQLETLKLSNVRLNQVEIKNFLNNNIVNLSLSSSYVGDDTLRLISASAPNIVHLTLNKNYLTPQGLESLSNLHKLATLNLSENSIGDEGVKAIKRISTLDNVLCEGNKVGKRGAEIFSSIKNIRRLNLNNNDIGDEGATFLSSMPWLVILELNNNNIGNSGAKSLAKLKFLKTLHLEGNNIGKEVQDFLTAHLKHCNIKF